MPQKAKIDKKELPNLLKSGRNQKDIADIYGVSTAAVNMAIKRLKLSAVKDVTLRSGSKIVKKNLDAIDQLQKVNDTVNEIIDGIRQSADRADKELLLKACDRIESQVKLQLEIFKTLYDIEAVAEFQKVVIEAIGEVAPKVRGQIITNLKKRKALRESVTFPQLRRDL